MFRNLLVLLAGVLSSIGLEAQPLPIGNEWINFSQTYFKIPVAQTSLYRITTTELQKAGVPVSQLDPTTVQLFHRGVEQAIYVEGEADKRFDAGDFLEFYGRGNDGTQDSLLYRPASAQPHKYYSLFSDTTAYFLTWRLDGKPGRRMATYSDTNFTNLTPEAYHWEEELRVFTQTYPAGNIYPIGANYENGAILTSYDVGEGWTGPVVKTNDRYDQTFTLANFISINGINPRASFLVVGRNPANHRVNYLAGASPTTFRTLTSTQFKNYNTDQFETELTTSDISVAGTIILTIQPQETGEEVSVSYLKLQYPQRTEFGTASQKILRLNTNVAGRSWLDLGNAGNTSRIFNITDPINPSRINGQLSAGHWQGIISNTQFTQTLLAVKKPQSVLAIKPVFFRQIDALKPNYLIVTHSSLRQPIGNETDPVRAYASYRASEAGGGYDTLTVTIDQLFDQFSYGERHALAIRRFADYMLRNGGSTHKFLFLIGQSRDPQGIRKNSNGPLLDLVPNAGWPGSDLGLVQGLNGQPTDVPAMPIGRLNASKSQQVLDYLNKVKEHENTTEPALWRKDILHLSGGANLYELQAFRSFTDSFKAIIESQYVGAKVTTLSKQTDNPVETLSVVDQINRGVSMISMFGHSSLDVADVDIGFVSDDRLGYRNKGRYPFLLANGCAAGNFYFGRPTFGADWILTPDRGAILFLAHTYNGFPFALKNLSDQLYSLLTDSNYVSRPVAYLHQEAIRRNLAKNTSIYDITTSQQVTLQGDPAVSVFPFPKADFAFATGSLAVSDTHGDTLTTQSDSVVISGVVVNYGRVANQPLPIRIRRYMANGQLIREQRFILSAPFYADTLQWKFPNDRTTLGTQFFELVIDPDNTIPEIRKTNNKAEINTGDQSSHLPFTPDQIPPGIEVAFDGKRIKDGDIVSAQPVIDILLQDENKTLLRTDTTGLELYLQSPCPTGSCPYKRLSLLGQRVHWTAAGADNAFRLSYQPDQPLADGVYAFEAIGNDLSGNRSAPYQIHFTVKNQPEVVSTGAYPNPFNYQTSVHITISGKNPPDNLSVQISDLMGHIVRTLGGSTRIGLNEWFWDGTSDTGSNLPSGVYVYKILGADFLLTTDAQLKGRIILNR
ncbi:C25 family cysteine peptidase [Spirosoma sp. SC4-14]|uniref:putative type IX secretion system sortase PorU2 n=1 Tax=Spirosoma sp. SC4-14 TaxID=3128900 RepID=UPI0030CCA1E5